MAEKVLQKNKALAPFLGSRLSIIRGLDPLGLQNASVRAYSYLLPGLNNVTERVRYYSFYCWLLGAYASHNGSTDPREQRRFIRKGEYLIALMSRLEDDNRTGIPGSDYAARKLGQMGEEAFELDSGIYNPDGSTTDTYWNASFGAFGQYYMGALRQIGLIGVQEDHPDIYVRTPKLEVLEVCGEALQDAFAANIPVEKQDLFIRLLQKETASRLELEQLLPEFDLTLIPEGSEEQALLLRLLMGKDNPTKLEDEPSLMRSQTIRLLLSYVMNGEIDLVDRAFTRQAYHLKGQSGGQLEDCLTGWYYYQFNEYWQVACTAILNGVLGYLENQSPVRLLPLAELIHRSTRDTLAVLSEQFEWLKVETPIQDVINAAVHIPDEWTLVQRLQREKHQQKMASGFLLVWKLYAENRAYLQHLKNYAGTRELTSDQDAATFYRRFDPMLLRTCLEFLESFLHLHIIRRHQLVALRKMGGGTQSTQKFILEEGHIRYLGNFDPAFTGPRVGNLIAFLKDLHIFDDRNQITDRGRALLA